jgi:hypothetical protein
MTAIIFSIISSLLIATVTCGWLTLDAASEDEPPTPLIDALGGLLVVLCMWIGCWLLAVVIEFMGVGL